jgi:hypothetical protein
MSVVTFYVQIVRHLLNLGQKNFKPKIGMVNSSTMKKKFSSRFFHRF